MGAERGLGPLGVRGAAGAFLVTRCLHFRKTRLGERRGSEWSVKLGSQTRLVQDLRNKVNSRETEEAMGSAGGFPQR